jgi:hypothetical protein
VASRQICLLRELESEITMAMYYPTISSGDISRNVPFSQWFTRIHERMSEWYQTTRQSINLSEKLEFHELLYQCQILRLNRATPRFPSPTKEMRKKTLQASIAVLKELSTIERAGKLFNIWHAGYFALEAAVCIMAIVLTGFHSQCRDHTSLEGVDIMTLCRYIQNTPSLLRKISRRWPNVARHASALEGLSQAVMEKMQQWLNGEEIEKRELCTLEAQLNQLSLFPPLPSKGEDSVIGDEQTLVPGSFQAMAQPTLSDELHPSLDHVELQLSDLAPAAAGSWADHQAMMEVSPSIVPDPYAFDGGSGLVWDFEEDILAAFD